MAGGCDDTALYYLPSVIDDVHTEQPWPVRRRTPQRLLPNPRRGLKPNGEAGRRWLAHLEAIGRCKSTVMDYESAVWMSSTAAAGRVPMD
jgi:hypothetical protein